MTVISNFLNENANDPTLQELVENMRAMQNDPGMSPKFETDRNRDIDRGMSPKFGTDRDPDPGFRPDLDRGDRTHPLPNDLPTAQDILNKFGREEHQPIVHDDLVYRKPIADDMVERPRDRERARINNDVARRGDERATVNDGVERVEPKLTNEAVEALSRDDKGKPVVKPDSHAKPDLAPTPNEIKKIEKEIAHVAREGKSANRPIEMVRANAEIPKESLVKPSLEMVGKAVEILVQTAQ